MTKLKITLTLTDAEAEMLVSTLKIGADRWYGAGLQRDAQAIAALVERRKDSAVLARGAARRRQDQKKIAAAYITAIGRASVKAADAGTEFSDAERVEIRASFYPAEAARILGDRSEDNDQV